MIISILFIHIAYTGKLSSIFRFKTALRTDERVRFMDEVISGVQVIKMYAWEKPFSKLIFYARKMELKIVRKSSYVRGLYMTFMLFTTRMALFVTMMTLALTSEPLTASRVFVVSAYFSIISSSMSQMFVRGIAEIAEVLVAMKRLQKFLEYSEKETPALPMAKEKVLNELGHGDETEKQKLIESESQLPSNIAISIKNANARWNIVESEEKAKQVNDRKIQLNGTKEKTKTATAALSTTTATKDKNGTVHNDNNDDGDDEDVNSAALTLENINIDFKKGILIGVVGSVGSGKSSLLQIILRELPLESGSVSIRGKLSYAGQEPWVFSGSVKQNIIFGQDMHRERYNEVVKACALLPDFEQFPEGDQSLIGERGASLSGGQRARISLARAVYRKADTYILDDPLSAVDAHVGRHLFDSVIGPKGRLAKLHATRILVTHQVHFLKEADWIVVIKNGRVELQGSPFDLSHSGIDIATLLEVEEKSDDEDGDSVSNKGGRTSRRQSSSKSVGSSLHSLHSNQGDESEADGEKNPEKAEEGPRRELEQTSKGTVKGSVSKSYFLAGGHPFVLFVIFILFILTQLVASGADFWVAFWTAQEEQRSFERSRINATDDEVTTEYWSNFTQIVQNVTTTELPLNVTDIIQTTAALLSTETCMYIHGGLVISIFVIGIMRSISFYSVCVRASQKLHDGVFKGIISTAMRFFDTNPSGRILNRFSKDLGSVDEYLPKAILDATQIILNMVGAIIVTTIVNPLFMVPIGVIGLLFVAVRRVYLKSSKNIKRLEGASKCFLLFFR